MNVVIMQKASPPSKSVCRRKKLRDVPIKLPESPILKEPKG